MPSHKLARDKAEEKAHQAQKAAWDKKRRKHNKKKVRKMQKQSENRSSAIIAIYNSDSDLIEDLPDTLREIELVLSFLYCLSQT